MPRSCDPIREGRTILEDGGDHLRMPMIERRDLPMQRITPDTDARLLPADQEIDRALIQLTYLFHDLARIDPVAQYFVAMAVSLLTDKRSASPGDAKEPSSLQ
jgi:hypothetical protein